MKIWKVILILSFMYPIAIAGAQFMTRLLKLNKASKPKKIWKFELPTKKELIFALIALVGLGLYMFWRGFLN